MKKYLLYTMLALTVFTSCKKGIEPAAGERPEERVSATLSAYSTALSGSTYGWKAFLYPDGGGTFLFSMKFGTTNRVNMLSDITTASSTTVAESSYRLRQQQGPSLLFDTYNYIHLLADPDPTVNGGTPGLGSSSDIEFYFDQTVGDTIKLIGNRLGSKLVLIKATSQADFDGFTTGYTKVSQLRTYFKRTTINGTDAEVKFNLKTREIAFSYVVNNALVSTPYSKFYVDGSANTMILITPLTVGSNVISTIKGITYDATNRIIGGTINSNAIQIKEAIAPLLYDTGSALAFFNNPPTGFPYWVSYSGFTVDNVPDAYKITSIPGWYYMLFYPKYNASYTRLGFIVNNAYAAYGPAPIASFPSNGRLVCSASAGTFGTTPASLVPMVSATTAKFMDAAGLYCIKIGSTYDLVNASDARSWITFE